MPAHQGVAAHAPQAIIAIVALAQQIAQKIALEGPAVLTLRVDSAAARARRERPVIMAIAARLLPAQA